MSNSNDAKPQRGCFLLLLILPILCIGLIVASIYWTYKNVGLYGAITAGLLFVVVIILIAAKSRRDSAIKTYVLINPENRIKIKSFINQLSVHQKREVKSKNQRDAQLQLNKIILSNTSKRYKILRRGDQLYRSEILEELDGYINFAMKKFDALSIEELNKLKELLADCKEVGVNEAFVRLGMTVANGLNYNPNSHIFIEYTRKSGREPRKEDKISTAEWTQFECKRCRNFFLDYVWLLIDIFERPDLFAQLSQIHVFECPHCGYKFDLMGGAITINFYSSRIPPLTIETSDGESYDQKAWSQEREKYFNKATSTYSQKMRQYYADDPHEISSYMTMHRDLAAMNIIHEAKELITEFAISYPSEFSEWLSGVLLSQKDLESAMLFYAGAKHDLSALYNYQKGKKNVGNEIFNKALGNLFEDRRSNTLKIIRFAVPVIGVLISISIFGQIPQNPNFGDWAKNGLYAGTVLGFILALISLFFSSILMSIESKIRRITLPTLKPRIDIYIYIILAVILGAISGLIFNLIAMGIYSIIGNMILLKLFAQVSGALFGLLCGLLLNNPLSMFSTILFARHARVIFS